MWWNFHDSDLDNGALNAWPSFAAEAGLPRTGWTLTKLSRRDDPDSSRIVLLAQHRSGDSYAYRFQLQPNSQDGFVAHYNRQKRAYDAISSNTLLTAPKPIYVSHKQQASLFEHIQGRTIGELVRNSEGLPKRQLDLLTKVGAWLDAYHRTQIEERRRFQPKYTVHYYENLKQQILAATVRVPAQSKFLAGIQRLTDLAPHFENRETISAIQHGDFHPANLIQDGARIVGLDFSSDKAAPVGHDISKILLDFSTLTDQAKHVEPGKVVPQAVLEAFFDGYRLVGADDPSVNFLLYARILSTLMRVPQKKSQRTFAKQRTLQRLRPFMNKAFESGTSVP